MLFTPTHQFVTGEAAVGAQDDAHFRPTLADPCDDPLEFLDRAGRCIDVGAPQLSRQQMTATEDIEML
jgi:hypothetical protein